MTWDFLVTGLIHGSYLRFAERHRAHDHFGTTLSTLGHMAESPTSAWFLSQCQNGLLWTVEGRRIVIIRYTESHSRDMSMSVNHCR